jgi:hypothetical protein
LRPIQLALVFLLKMGDLFLHIAQMAKAQVLEQQEAQEAQEPEP